MVSSLFWPHVWSLPKVFASAHARPINQFLLDTDVNLPKAVAVSPEASQPTLFLLHSPEAEVQYLEGQLGDHARDLKPNLACIIEPNHSGSLQPENQKSAVPQYQESKLDSYTHGSMPPCVAHGKSFLSLPSNLPFYHSSSHLRLGL